MFGTEKEDAQQTTSKKLTEEEWKNGDSFTGLDFNSGWQMGTDGPEMTGADSIFSLEVTGQPTCCYVGEELYRWGSLKVNNFNYIQITSDMIAQFDSSKSGNSQVVVRYMGRTLTYSIKVKEPVTVASQSFIPVEKTQILSSSDNGSVYDLYAGSVLPGKYNAVSCRLGTVTIQAPLQIDGQSSHAGQEPGNGAGDAVASWSSSNKKAAVVNARTGKITARKTGKTTITVTMQSGATAKCLIKIQKGRVKTKKLNVGKTAITLKKGEKYRITWERQPLTSSEKVTFQSSRKKIASVSGKGIVTAKKKGPTYITVKSGSKKRKIKVTVR